jgi:flagellar biosynthesis protein FlhG
MGKQVLLLDADLGLANINIILGFQPKATLDDMLAGKATLKDVIVSHRSGLDIIPASSGITSLTNLSDTARHSLIDAIDTLSGQYDFLLVDTSAGIGDNVTYFNVAAEQVLVVVDPEPTSITDAYALMKVLSTQHGIKEFFILANRAENEAEGKQTYAQLSSVNNRFLNARLHYLGCVADDASVIQAVMKQTPFFELFPTAKASRDISRIAKLISEQEPKAGARGGMQFFFKELIEHA